MTWLARMRQARLYRLVILCIPLLMVVTPAAHRLAMALSGALVHKSAWAVLERWQR